MFLILYHCDLYFVFHFRYKTFAYVCYPTSIFIKGNCSHAFSIILASAGNEALMSRPGTNYFERNCLADGGPGPGNLGPSNPQGTLFSRMDTQTSKLRVKQ
jgi:hypothetical protein